MANPQHRDNPRHRDNRAATGRAENARGEDPFAELSLPAKVSIPEMFRKHRHHHGLVKPESLDLRPDSSQITQLGTHRRELVVHVLSQVLYAAATIRPQLPEFHRIAGLRAGGAEADIHRSIETDVDLIIGLAARYLREVCRTEKVPEEALTRSFRRLIDNTLVPHFQHFADTEGMNSNLKAEVQLRTAYHIVTEGLGAGTAIQGVNTVLKQLHAARQHRPGPESNEILPGLAAVFQALRFIERRNVAYGLFCLDRLGSGFNYIGTSKTILDTYKKTKPILLEAQKETFTRWARFPARVDRAELQLETANHVRGWVRRLLIPGLGYKSSCSLASML